MQTALERRASARENTRRWRRKFPMKARILSRRNKGIPDPTRPEPPVCELCKCPPKRGFLVVDHCHKTGKFRGWLCSGCNSGLGLLDDDLAGILKAAEYLNNHDVANIPN